MASVQDQLYLMWIDAVGGYLVCPQASVTIGQAVPGNRVEIPVQGDLSTFHATILRMGETYVLSPHAKTRIANRVVEGAVPLHDGDEILFNQRVQFRFRQPHPLSHTARLELLSPHRMQPAVDGVILLAESCVLGPNPSSHIVCRPWTSEVIVARTGDGLRCKAPGEFWIDGKAVQGLSPLRGSSLVQGEGFSWRLEPWGRGQTT